MTDQRTGDKQEKLNTLATEVVRAAMHGDQQFIACLLADDQEVFHDLNGFYIEER